MVKKALHAAVISVLLIALGFLVYLCITSLKGEQKQIQKVMETEKETQALELEVLHIPVKDMERISLQKGEDIFAFHKEENQWIYVDYESFPVDQELFAEKLSKVEMITATEILQDPENLSEYGLESPEYQLEIYTENEVWTILMGDEIADTGASYIKLKGYKEVYRVDSSIAEAFQCDLYDLAAVREFPRIPMDAVTGIEIESEEKTIGFEKQDKEDEEQEPGERTWKVESEQDSAAADYEKITELLEKMENLEYFSYADYQAEDLEKYGLQEPGAEIRFYYMAVEAVDAPEELEEEKETGEEETEEETEPEETLQQLILQIGNQDETGNYYVKLSSSEEVSTMKEREIQSWLELSYGEMTDPAISNISLDEAENLNVTYAGRTYELSWEEKSGENAELDTEKADTENQEQEYRYYVNEEEAEQSDFMNFWNMAASLQVKRRLEGEPEDLPEPILTMEYEKRDGDSLRVEYVLYEGDEYLVKTSDAPPGIVDKLEVRKLLQMLKRI